MLKIELRPRPDGAPGQGELWIAGWKQSTEGLQLGVQRNQDDFWLDDGGNWHASARRNPLNDVREAEGKLCAAVGPWLVDALIAERSMTYMLYLQNAEGHDKGGLRIIGELLSSKAGVAPPPPAPPKPPVETKAEPEPAPPPPAPAPEPPPPPAEPEPAPAAPPEPPPPAPKAPAAPKKTRWLWPLLLALLLLAAAAAAFWWFVLRASPAAVPTAPAAEAESGACSGEMLESQSDDLLLIQNCLKTAPASAEILQLIEAAKAAKRCNLVQRLYAHKAQAGDSAVALAYAREYDPASFKKGGCIESADAETAVYWYELVLDQDPANSDAKQRLEALKK